MILLILSIIILMFILMFMLIHTHSLDLLIPLASTSPMPVYFPLTTPMPSSQSFPFSYPSSLNMPNATHLSTTSISFSLKVVNINPNNSTAINNRVNPKQYVLSSDNDYVKFVYTALFKCKNKSLYAVIICFERVIIRGFSISRCLYRI